MQLAERQSIESEIVQLVIRFAHFIDKGQYEDLAQLFTEDGQFDRVGQVLVGRAAILEAMQKRHSFLTRHFISTVLFTRVETNEAEATMYVANFVGASHVASLPVAFALPQPAILEFDDVYHRTHDGWRIARRVARQVIKSDVPPTH